MSRRFWSSRVRELKPYTPGEQPQVEKLIKLNTNECPYPPSPRVLDAIRGVSGEDLLRYPDPDSRILRSEIADFHGLLPAQVFVGNGSDEVLSHVFLALLKQPGALLFPDISYSFYPVWCQLHDISYRCVPLREDFSLAAEDYDAAAPAVIVPNPNAPTGMLMPLDEVRRFLDSAPDRLLVLDEAYIDFGGETAIPLIDEYDNLLVVQTLSKSRALAGLRVGVAFGHRQLIEALERVKDSFNSYPMDAVAQRAATAAYQDRPWFEESCQRVIDSRSELMQELEELGFSVLPSAANFLFARHDSVSGVRIFSGLRDRGILLRRWDKPRIEEFLRISIGTPAQCEALLNGLREVLSELEADVP